MTHVKFSSIGMELCAISMGLHVKFSPVNFLTYEISHLRALNERIKCNEIMYGKGIVNKHRNFLFISA